MEEGAGIQLSRRGVQTPWPFYGSEPLAGTKYKFLLAKDEQIGFGVWGGSGGAFLTMIKKHERAQASDIYSYRYLTSKLKT